MMKKVSCRLIYVSVIFFGVSFAVSGCSSLPFVGGKSLEGRVQTARMQWNVQNNSAIESRPSGLSNNMQGMVDRLTAVSPLVGAKIPVQGVEDKAVNAYTEGKQIFVTRGMVEQTTGNADQLAGVLGHELGHIIGGHIAQAQGRGVVSGLAGQLLTTLRPEESKAALAAEKLLSETMKLGEAAYGRQDEEEADVIGTILAYDAGFNPLALAQFFDKLEPKKDVSMMPYISQLIPVLIQYQSSKSLLENSLKAYQKSPSPELKTAGIQAAQKLQLFKSTADKIVKSYALNVAGLSDFYRSHPAGQNRIATIQMVTDALKGKITAKELLEKDAKVGKAYLAMQQYRPKFRK